MTSSAAATMPATTAIRSLAQWIRQTLGNADLSVKMRQRGNTLQILLEGNPCPEEPDVLPVLIRACLDQEQNFSHFLPAHHAPIYRLVIYARQTGNQTLQWQKPLYLNQLQQHLAIVSPLEASSTVVQEIVQEIPDSGENPPDSSSTQVPTFATAPTVATPQPPVEETPDPDPVSTLPLIISNRSLANQGDPEAIAHYLSETFNSLGIAVQVQAKGLAKGNGLSMVAGQVQRLQVVCESPYSLDAAILAEPLSQQLRDLDLHGFRDAVVISRVAGEPEVDWVLRVDLTPPEEMLRDLARWGDTIALSALVDRHLVNLQVKTEVELKDKTLHLFCKSQSTPPVAPQQGEVMEILRSLLQSLAPQGIHASMIYGLRPHLTPQLEQGAPLWVDWLGLPAAQHPDLAPSARELADAGDLEAVSFLINRLLNPDLKAQLRTGGIRVYLRRKLDLIHVMCDAPTCPRQGDVGMRVVNLIRQLRLPHIAGVRVYGRQSGQKEPIWCHGVDFIPRKRDVPEATPEFAASAQHLGDVLAASPEALNLDLEDTEPADLVTWDTVIAELREGMRRALITTQLFLPAEQDPSQGLGLEVPW
ncbi:MAG: hypothetical protein ACO3NK_12135, partial [Prochlorotrichaceae cyanobacterium]